MTRTQRCVGAVILTYNSSEELHGCIIGLRAQREVDVRIIIVDNASKPDERAQMQTTFQEVIPDGQILPGTAAADPNLQAVFLCNSINSGYSAGNNIGARFAVETGCEAVLIINPDVQIENPYYLVSLFDIITADAKTAVASSAVTSLSGAHENPMIEPSFFEEFFWPIKMVGSRFFRQGKKNPTLFAAPQRVEKVTGACFLIRTDFLRRIGFFDESVFLYCEESILSAQVRAAGWHIIMDPRINALHAHKSDLKADSLLRFTAWAESRRRFHKTHGGYGPIRQRLLSFSRMIILWLVQGKSFLKTLRGRIQRMASRQ
jgi:GT2 family glycosyltransferase